MGYILGIDQGGSNTRAAIMDHEGNILSYYRTSGSYFPRVGIESAMDVIWAATQNTIKDANIKTDDIDMIVAGITGIDWENDEIIVINALKKQFKNKKIIACNDCEIAFYSGSLKPEGAVICAGTGINAAIFTPTGKKFVMGDYLKTSLQGATAIVIRAIEAVFESDLGMLPETELTRLFLDFSCDNSVIALMHRYMTEENYSKKVISLTPKILALASNGDEVARGILSEFADEVCACFIAAMKKMDMLEVDCDIVLAGSVFTGRTNVLTAMVTKKVLQSIKNANIVNAAFEPVVGACILGILKESGKIDECILENMSVSAEKSGLLRLLPAI